MRIERPYLAVVAVFFFEALAFSSWLPRLPEIRAALGLDEAALGVVLMGMPAGALLMMPIAGFLSTRLDVRSLNAVGMTILLAATAALPLAGSAQALFAILVMVGLGTGSMGVAMNAAGLAVEKALGRSILARCHAFFSIGVAAGGALGGLAAAQGVPLAVQTPALSVAIAACLLVLARPLPREREARESAGPRFALPTRALLPPALIAFFCLLSEGAALDWSAIHLRDGLGAQALVGAGVVAFGGAMALARFFGDAISSRLGTVATVAWGAVLAGCGFAAVALAPTAPVAIVGFALAGLGIAGIVPIAFRTAGATPGLPPGVSVAAVSTIGYVGFLAGPSIMGFIGELVGLAAAFGVVAAAMAIVAVLSARLRVREAGEPAERAGS
ncbi:MFS transporter [Salinarimonas chemoclinalis]|uniref:MFS transporter n=1 Tax=Salinarimonas chemoclinalis TaxID=3241599 RepID=UPI0035561F87